MISHYYSCIMEPEQVEKLGACVEWEGIIQTTDESNYYYDNYATTLTRIHSLGINTHTVYIDLQ